MGYSNRKKEKMLDPSCCPEPWLLKHLAPFQPDQPAGLEEGRIRFTFSWASDYHYSERIWLESQKTGIQWDLWSPLLSMPAPHQQGLFLHGQPNLASSGIAETFPVIPPQHNIAEKNQGLSVSLPPTADSSIRAGVSKARQSFHPLSHHPVSNPPRSMPRGLSQPRLEPSTQLLESIFFSWLFRFILRFVFNFTSFIPLLPSRDFCRFFSLSQFITLPS